MTAGTCPRSPARLGRARGGHGRRRSLQPGGHRHPRSGWLGCGRGRGHRGRRLRDGDRRGSVRRSRRISRRRHRGRRWRRPQFCRPRCGSFQRPQRTLLLEVLDRNDALDQFRHVLPPHPDFLLFSLSVRRIRVAFISMVSDSCDVPADVRTPSTSLRRTRIPRSPTRPHGKAPRLINSRITSSLHDAYAAAAAMSIHGSASPPAVTFRAINSATSDAASSSRACTRCRTALSPARPGSRSASRSSVAMKRDTLDMHPGCNSPGRAGQRTDAATDRQQIAATCIQVPGALFLESMPNTGRKRGRPAPVEWPQRVRLWLTYDRNATAPNVKQLLSVFGFDVPERTVRQHMKQYRVHVDRRRTRGVRQRAQPTRALASAAQTLINRGSSVGDAQTILGAMAIDAFTDRHAWNALVAARKKKTEGAARTVERLRRGFDGDMASYAERVHRAAERVRKARKRVGSSGAIERPQPARDPSPPCTQPCDGMPSAHRHCIVCDRTWAESTAGAGALFVPATSQHESGAARKILMYRYAVWRAGEIVWTAAPQPGDSFVWCCDRCRRAAADTLPESLDRDALLRGLPPTPVEWVRTKETASPFERTRRRTPGLWSWTQAEPSAIESPSIAPVLPPTVMSLAEGGTVTAGVAARMVFVGGASPARIVQALLFVQQIASVGIRRFCNADPATRSRTPPAEDRPVRFWTDLPGVPSLGMRDLHVEITIHDVAPPEAWPAPPRRSTPPTAPSKARGPGRSQAPTRTGRPTRFTRRIRRDEPRRPAASRRSPDH